MKYYKNIKNKIDFFLRRCLSLSRRNYSEPNEPKEELLLGEQIEQEKMLAEKFDLSNLKSNSTRRNYLENLYTLDILNKYLPIDFQDEIKILDIGCKNWFYAKGEHIFFKKFCNNLTLKGIELDANRLYTNLFSRKEAAKFYTQGLNAEYIEGDLLKHNGKYDYIIWILPFIFEEPLLKWGLPLSFFRPEEMLRKAYEILKTGGKMLIINQGVDEYNEQKALCKKLNIKYEQIGEITSPFGTYKIPRFAILINN